MHSYVYDRAVCTGLGDRVGAMMALATLAHLHRVEVVFRWCGDPSEIYPSQRRFMPRWHGFDYNLTEFRARFLPPAFPLTVVTPDLSAEQRRSPRKITWQGLEVPAEAGLDQVYTTAFRAMQVPGRPAVGGGEYLGSYRAVAGSVVDRARSANAHVTGGRAPYVAVHMRGPDENTYEPSPGFHDRPEYFCTGKVLRRLLKRVPGARVLVTSNNASWARGLIRSRRVEFLTDTNAYDDFALFLGASGIVQHANGGWSSYSSNPAMMAGVPLITTYHRHLQHHRFDVFENYGGVPENFHDCREINAFAAQVRSRLQEV